MLTILLLLFCTKNAFLFKSSFCIKENEEFSLCGWKCPATCVNLKILATDMCPSTWECYVGCRCSVGYVKNEYTKTCIRVQDCPAMETVLLACTFAAFAFTVTGAPTYADTEEQLVRQYPEDYQHLREIRSQYAPQYITPCAAAAAGAGAAHLSGYGAPYHLNVPGYAVPQYGGYGGQHYRSASEHVAEPEMLMFSDMGQFQQGQGMMMDHAPMARSGYGAPLASLNSGLALNGQVLTSASGPAYGVFPNANVAGCNIPLLFSCSPSISSGHILESSSHGVSGVSGVSGGSGIISAPSYRLVQQPSHHELQDRSEESIEQHSESAHETGHVVQAHS